MEQLSIIAARRTFPTAHIILSGLGRSALDQCINVRCMKNALYKKEFFKGLLVFSIPTLLTMVPDLIWYQQRGLSGFLPCFRSNTGITSSTSKKVSRICNSITFAPRTARPLMQAASYNGRDRMVIGIAMVKVLPDQERSVYGSLKGKEGILDIYHVFGEYDFFLIMQAESLAKLNGLMEDIQEIRHIITAQTYW